MSGVENQSNDCMQQLASETTQAPENTEMPALESSSRALEEIGNENFDILPETHTTPNISDVSAIKDHQNVITSPLESAKEDLQLSEGNKTKCIWYI